MKTIRVEYFALFREQAGRRDETVLSDAADAAALYEELRNRHAFTPGRANLRVAINDAYADWSTALGDGDKVVFIPPVAGG